MIFEEIELFNFGIYKGHHRVTLDCPEHNQPIVLIGALNGAGKTTFLDALQLALYGKHAKCSNRGRLSYPSYLEKCINSYSNNKSASIKLRFRHGENKNIPHVYEVTRSWEKEELKECKEVVHVLYNGIYDELLSENWDEFVNEFIPQSISELFFFDGEKIENLANPKRSAELLKSGIEALLGLELLSTLAMDLNEIKKKKQSKLLKEEDTTNLKEVSEKIYSLNKIKDSLLHDLKKIESDESDLLDLYSSSQEKLRASGADRISSRDALRQEKNAIINNITIFKHELLKIASNNLPLNLVSDYISEAEEQALIEKEYKTFLSAKNLLENQKKFFLNLLKELLDQESLSKAQEKVNNSYSKQKAEKDSEIFLNIEPSFFHGLMDRIAVDKANATEWLKKEIDAEHQLGLIEKKINTLPTFESVSELIADNVRLEEKLSSLKIIKQNIAKKISENEKEIDNLINLQNAILLKTSSEDFEKKRQNQIISHIDTLKDIAISFNEKLVFENVTDIENKIKIKFDKLKRKDSLINRVEINPSNYSMKIYNDNNEEITADRLSAGERQLLSISILWALAESSGKELPTIIDTPMGRLDGEHRNRLISEYFPNAASQVILLSTDEEIYGSYYLALKPYLAKEYHLSYDEKLCSSSFKSGYFKVAQ